MIDADLTLVDSTDELLACRAWLGERRDWLAYDVETTGVNVGRDRVRLGQIGDRAHGWAFPCEGAGSWYAAFAELLSGYDDSPVVAHNAIFDASFAKRDGWPIRPELAHDTMVMAQLYQSEYAVGLKNVAARLIDKEVGAGEKLLKGAYAKQGWDWRTVPVEFMPYWAYGALDTVLTARLAEFYWDKVQYARRTYEIEMGAIHILSDAQIRGMRVDIEYAERVSDELGARMDALEPSCPVNPGSPKQVLEFLQGAGAKLWKKTDKDNYSTDDEVLAYWEETIPECKPMREWRECKKLRTSYFDSLLRHQTDGIVHPSIRTLGAARTGRMSVTEPALQTLPKSAIGRNAFLARPGHTIVLADFNGIEMRLLAHCADVKGMKEAFARGDDVHTWTAKELFHVDTPTKKQRALAKGAGFGKVFGSGLDTFAHQTKLSKDDAEQFMEMYERLFPEIETYRESQIRQVEATAHRGYGEIYTEFGNRLGVPKREAYTKGVNYAIQGTAGQVLKQKLVELSAAGLGETIRLPIHDEIFFEVLDEDVEDVIATIKEVMPEREMFDVPLEVEVETVKRWGHAYLEDGEEPLPLPEDLA